MEWPLQLFIEDEVLGNDSLLNFRAWKEVKNIEDGIVAVYELKKVVNKKTEIILENT
mgnify:CR=1 FL=1